MKIEVYPVFSLRRFRTEWRWRARAQNGRIMADSGESYVRKVECIEAIRKLREAFPLARLEDKAS